LLASTIIVEAHINKEHIRFNKNINNIPTRFNLHEINKPSHFNIKDEHKICTITKISTKTKTITESCIPTPATQHLIKVTITIMIITISRDSPGCNNLVHPGFGGAINIVGVPTPQDCCLSCINNSTCVKWVFNPNLSPPCLVAVNGTDGNQCNGTVFSPSSQDNKGGSVRCNDGSICS
ncbi:36869_t:CDS:2, partial [Gigaspora margarita]